MGSTIFKRICFLELETLPITVGGRTTPRGLDWPITGEERRRIEMRRMSRCFIVYWLVLGGVIVVLHSQILQLNPHFCRILFHSIFPYSSIPQHTFFHHGKCMFLDHGIFHPSILYSGPHKWDNVLRCIFNQMEIPNGQKKEVERDHLYQKVGHLHQVSLLQPT